jgi:hypothetical protein
MSDMGTLQLAAKLEKGTTPLLVLFLKCGMVLYIASQPRWIIWGGTGGHWLQAAFDSTNMMVAIMVRTITMPITRECCLTMQNATAWVTYGDAIDDEHTTFICTK